MDVVFCSLKFVSNVKYDKAQNKQQYLLCFQDLNFLNVCFIMEFCKVVARIFLWLILVIKPMLKKLNP